MMCQEAWSFVYQTKRKNWNENACVEGSDKKSKGFPITAKKVVSQKKLVATVPHHSLTKQITSYDLKTLLAVKRTFCSSVGLLGSYEITLKTSMDNTRSWPVSFKTTNTYGYIAGQGWKRFCWDNRVKEGDHCTFNVVKTRVWHVTILSRY
uniref:TF-B3 domain-containing protein n=1 Tax=Arundo donax TaxID=35708 RepID=A0A0A8XNU7_ARUDO